MAKDKTAKDLAKEALVALRTLAEYSEATDAPEDVTKAAKRLARRMETVFGRVVLHEEVS